jgi:predicted phosphodiesterase
MGDYVGLLFVGDPHLSPRAPGFRKDEYAQTVLGKLKWCIDYTRSERLVPVLLGDLFHHPRDISNRLLVDLISLFAEPVWTIAGNHDCSENVLSDNDTLAVLDAAGCIRLLDKDGPCKYTMNGAIVILGGTAWGQHLPKTFDSTPYRRNGEPWFTFWITHHDIRFPGYDDSGRFNCREIPGIDCIINGHIHRSLPQVTAGGTTWINPGNICRVSRGDATKQHTPRVLRMDVAGDGWKASQVDLPHQPFDDVFFPQVASETVDLGESTFIKELAALESARTSGGAGLKEFLDANLAQFPHAVANEIRTLAQEVLSNAN